MPYNTTLVILLSLFSMTYPIQAMLGLIDRTCKNNVKYRADFESGNSEKIQRLMDLPHFGQLDGYLYREFFYIAAKNGDLATLHALLSYQGETKEDKINGKKWFSARAFTRNETTLLHVAVRQGHVSVVQRLLTAQADSQLQDNDGNTPLHIACQEGHRKIVEELLIYGADLSSQNKLLQSPLYIASIYGHKEIVDLLLTKSSKKEIEQKDRSGVTALLKICGLGRDCHIKVIPSLLTHGADASSQDMRGNTALHNACKKNNQMVVALLTLHDPTLVNRQNMQGNTPLHYASWRLLPAMVSLLLTPAWELKANQYNKTPLDDISEKSKRAILASAAWKIKCNPERIIEGYATNLLLPTTLVTLLAQYLLSSAERALVAKYLDS